MRDVESENRQPSLEEFKRHVTEQFGYLISEFGMQEAELEHDNPYAVAFANDWTRIEIEGINWGFGLQVHVGEVGQRSSTGAEGTPLWALIKYVQPEAFEELTTSSRQLELIERHARLLRTHFAQVLRGEDFTIVHEVDDRFSPEKGYDI